MRFAPGALGTLAVAPRTFHTPANNGGQDGGTPSANARVARQKGYGATACFPRSDGLRTFERNFGGAFASASHKRRSRLWRKRDWCWRCRRSAIRSGCAQSASFRSPNLSRAPDTLAACRSEDFRHGKNFFTAAKNRTVHAVGRPLRKGDRFFARRIRFVFRFVLARRLCSVCDFAIRNCSEDPQFRRTQDSESLAARIDLHSVSHRRARFVQPADSPLWAFAFAAVRAVGRRLGTVVLGLGEE